MSPGEALKSEHLNDQALGESQRDFYLAFRFPLQLKLQISTQNVNEWNVENLYNFKNYHSCFQIAFLFCLSMFWMCIRIFLRFHVKFPKMWKSCFFLANFPPKECESHFLSRVEYLELQEGSVTSNNWQDPMVRSVHTQTQLCPAWWCVNPFVRRELTLGVSGARWGTLGNETPLNFECQNLCQVENKRNLCRRGFLRYIWNEKNRVLAWSFFPGDRVLKGFWMKKWGISERVQLSVSNWRIWPKGNKKRIKKMAY